MYSSHPALTVVFVTSGASKFRLKVADELMSNLVYAGF